MFDADIETLRRCFPRWRPQRPSNATAVRPSVLVVSQDREYLALIAGLLSSADIAVFDRRDHASGQRFHACFVLSMLMFSERPLDYLEHLLSISDEVWLQEPIRAWRCGKYEVDPKQGDMCRFTFPARGELAREGVPALDLESDGRFTVEEIEFYDGPPDVEGHDHRRFIAVVKRRRATGSSAGPSKPHDDDSHSVPSESVRR